VCIFADRRMSCADARRTNLVVRRAKGIITFANGKGLGHMDNAVGGRDPSLPSLCNTEALKAQAQCGQSPQGVMTMRALP